MEWTRETPTEEGYYWFTGKWGPLITVPVCMVQIWVYEKTRGNKRKGLAVFMPGDEKAYWADACDGWWQGPLEKPTSTTPTEQARD
jgi:hypothetical protein